mgnify:CR=1 FL=1
MESPTTIKKRDSYHHGDLRAQLIEATRRLVEEKGPDHFSVSEACRVAGVSTAAPYKHFKDKNEMLQEVAMDGMQRHHQEMLAEIEPYPVGSLDRIIGLGRVYTRFAQREPGVFRLMFGLSDDHDECERLVTQGNEVYSVVKLEVARCRGSETVGPEDEKRAFMLWSFVHGLSFLAIDGKLKDFFDPAQLEGLLIEVGARVMRDS